MIVLFSYAWLNALYFVQEKLHLIVLEKVMLQDLVHILLLNISFYEISFITHFCRILPKYSDRYEWNSSNIHPEWKRNICSGICVYTKMYLNDIFSLKKNNEDKSLLGFAAAPRWFLFPSKYQVSSSLLNEQ